MSWFSSIANKIKAIVSNAASSVRDTIIQQINNAVSGVARRFTQGAEIHRQQRQRRINLQQPRPLTRFEANQQNTDLPKWMMSVHMLIEISGHFSWVDRNYVLRAPDNDEEYFRQSIINNSNMGFYDGDYGVAEVYRNRIYFTNYTSI